MPEIQILTACSLAFAAVFVLLSFLAMVMQVLVTLFPERKTEVDPGVVAAISTSVAAVMPGARVIRIEEK